MKKNIIKTRGPDIYSLYKLYESGDINYEEIESYLKFL